MTKLCPKHLSLIIFPLVFAVPTVGLAQETGAAPQADGIDISGELITTEQALHFALSQED